MKVLQDNYNQNSNIEENIKQPEPYPRKIICENCRSELEYEKSDMRMGFLGCMYLDCPLCGCDNMLEENENSIILTADNINFPIHFSRTSKDSGAVDCFNNEEIKKCIRKGIKFFRENKDAYYWFTQYGNLHINIYKYDGDEDYHIITTNDFYSTHIPFEKEDY